MSRLKNLTKKNSFLSSSIIYVLGSFLTGGIAFITTPIFTRLLTPEDFGITSVFMTWVSVFTIFIGLQTSSTIATAHIHYDKSYIKFLNNQNRYMKKRLSSFNRLVTSYT